MSRIADIRNPWRDKWKAASFRGVQFFMETGGQAGGRRTAVHEYPKRNTPYSEDMGRKAVKLTVQAYQIGPDYLDDKDKLIEALEKDGPGMLRLPLPYKMRDIEVMVVSYSVTEQREAGGICRFDMEFVEYGSPNYRVSMSTTSQIDSSAQNAEKTVMGPPAPETKKQTEPYRQIQKQSAINSGYEAV
jgi:prophage DNA circulation protein